MSFEGAMRRSKDIICLVLALTVILYGLPLFGNNGDRCGTTNGLEDAIRHVRDFAGSAEDISAFSSGMKKAMTALHLAAGLKTVLRSAKDSKSISNSVSPDTLYLVSTSERMIPLNNWEKVPGAFPATTSIKIPPDTPPPRRA
jgi:hypothetical protein